MITVDHQRCMRCKKCVDDCVVKVLVADKEGVPHLPAELERFCLNCQHCLAICPTAALSCNGITPDMCAAPGPLPRPDEMMNLIRMRRSCRHYKNENIPPEIMAQLKSSLAWTPTGCNDRKLFPQRNIKDPQIPHPYRDNVPALSEDQTFSEGNIERRRCRIPQCSAHDRGGSIIGLPLQRG